MIRRLGGCHLYIHRSVLLLFAFICLILMAGMEWASAPDAAWYRPFLLAGAIILLAALMQRHQESDDH